MKAAAFLMSLIVLPVALPAQAKDSDDLSSWTLEELCERKDKDRHAEAVLAELERRDVFSASDLELVRSNTIDRGMHESALLCSWGAPDSVQFLVLPIRQLPICQSLDNLQRKTDHWIRGLGPSLRVKLREQILMASQETPGRGLSTTGSA